MITHTIYNQVINDSIRVELVYENYPVIAGTDELSLILRFRYIGELNNNTTPIKPHKEEKPADEDKKSEENEGWFGRRISSQFSNATRSMFLRQLETLNEEEDDNRLKDVSIFLGYTQMFGYYSINDKIIDSSIFEELQKSTTIEGKLAGINGLEITYGQTKRSLLNGLSTLFNTDISSPSEDEQNKDSHLIPIYSTNQSILFSDLTFKPSQLTTSSTSKELTKSYYINMKLPKDIPPSYKSESVQINYSLILGYQLMKDDRTFTNKTIFFPLKIQPFIDRYGRQPLYHLERPKLNQKPEVVKSVDVNSTTSSDQPIALGQNGRRLSFNSIRRKLSDPVVDPGSLPQFPRRSSSNISIPELQRRSSVVSIESLIKRRPPVAPEDFNFELEKDTQTQNFLQILKTLNDSDVNDIIRVQETFEKQVLHNEKAVFNSRENLINILADYQSVQKYEYYPEQDEDDIDFEGMIPKQQQTKYIIKQNHLHIAKVNLNKSIFKVGDQITLNLSFLENELETKGLDIRLMKDEIIYRDEYLKRNEYDDVHYDIKNGNHLETVIFEKLLSSFNYDDMNVNLLIPNTSESQFKTNFFQLKYYIQIKFILLDSYDSIKKQKQKKTERSKTDQAMESETNGENETLVGASTVHIERTKFDLDSIFTDAKGSILFRAVDHFANGFEFTIRLPIVVLPNYEHDFGSVNTKL